MIRRSETGMILSPDNTKSAFAEAPLRSVETWAARMRESASLPVPDPFGCQKFNSFSGT